MRDLTKRLLEARRTGQGITDLPDALVPMSEEEAFAVQAEVVAALGERVAGRKVGVLPDGSGIGAPLLSGAMMPTGASVPFSALSLELEIAVRLGRDVAPPPAGRPYTREDVLAALDGVAAAFELVASRFAEPESVPRLAFLADSLAQAGTVIGPFRPLSAWPDMPSLTCRVEHEGSVLHEGPARHPAGDPLVPLIAYLNREAHAMAPLRAGEVVITGALCGLLPIPGPGTLTGTLRGFDALTVTLR